MSTQLKLRRGTTAQHSTFTGAEGEVTVDTDKDTLVVHDGTTAGGKPVLPASNPSYTGTLTGGTGVVNLGSGQVYKDASGNVGIGTTAPAYPLDVLTNAALSNATGAQKSLFFRQTNLSQQNGAAVGAIDDGNYSQHLNFFTKTPGASGNALVERARIDSSGNLLVGSTAAPFGSAPGVGLLKDATGGRLQVGVNVTTSYNVAQFYNPNGLIGSINVSGGATSYVTSSDYRLKEAIAPMTGALAKVALLKPCTYKWKVDGSDGQGFIAHELAEVEPGCVTGEKDAVDADGKPQYQGIDTSFLVATLAAAIQELKVIVDTQATAITALTARIDILEQGGV